MKKLQRLFEQVLQETLALESPINITFKQQLSLISDKVKRTKVENILRRMSTRNTEEAASSTGKYHPSFAHGKGGLGRHTKAVVAFASSLCTALPELNRDSMVIAALMHDMMKYKDDEKYTSKQHAADIAKLLKDEGLDTEARLCASHMGQWEKNGPTPQKFDEKMLHLADYLASRQFVHIDFDESDDIVENNNTIDRDEYKDKYKTTKNELDMWSGKKDIPF